MSFLSNVTNTLSNPFVRQIATGLGGVLKGNQGASAVNQGFAIFDQLLSSFNKASGTANTGAAAQTQGAALTDPRNALADLGNDGVGTAQAAATAAPAADVGGTGGGMDAIIEKGLGQFGSSSALSPTQEKMLKSIEDPKERARMKMQMQMQNEQNLIQLISNLVKMMGDTQKAIIQNIRA